MKPTEHPFAILEANTRDNRNILQQKAGSKGACAQSMLSTLTDMQRRLASEVSWFPDTSDKLIAELLTFLKEAEAGHILPAPDMAMYTNPLSRMNAICAALRYWQIYSDKMFTGLARSVACATRDVDVAGTLRAINVDRALGGYPAVSAQELEPVLRDHMRAMIRRVLCAMLERLQLMDLGNFIMGMNADGSFEHNDVLKETLLEYYGSKANEQIRGKKAFAEQQYKNVAARQMPSREDIQGIIRTLQDLFALNKPLRRLNADKDEDAWALLFGLQVRSLVVDYVNKSAPRSRSVEVYGTGLKTGTKGTMTYQSREDTCREAIEMNRALRLIFSDVDIVTSKLEEDDRTLNDMIEREKTAIRNNVQSRGFNSAYLS